MGSKEVNGTIKVIFSLILTMFFLCGCNSDKSSKTVIKFASWGSRTEVEILKPVLTQFEDENPDIKVDFMHIPQNYFQKIHLLFASNTAPDVIFLNNHYLPVYANAGLLLELNADKDIFYNKALDALSWKGKLYAIPRDISTLVIFYNKDIFKRNGVSYPSSDWTMAEFLEAAEKLTSRGEVYGISFEEDALFYLPYLMSMGGGILSDDLCENISDNDVSQNSLKFYADLRKKYHVAPLKNESASATMAQMFLQGKLAMHLSGRWLVPKYREDALFDWDIARFPKGDKGSIVPLDSSGWAISSKTKNPEAAKRLVDYLSSKPVSEKFTASGLIVPARKDVAESDVYLNNKKPYNSKVFLDVIETSKSTPVSVNYREILDNLKIKNELIFN